MKSFKVFDDVEAANDYQLVPSTSDVVAREPILQWLRSLDIDQFHCALSITSEPLVRLILYFFHQEGENASCSLNESAYTEPDPASRQDCWYIRSYTTSEVAKTLGGLNYSEKKKEAIKLIKDNLRITSRRQALDTFIFNKEMNHEMMLQTLDNLTDGKFLKFQTKEPLEMHNTCEWLVVALENVIKKRYLEKDMKPVVPTITMLRVANHYQRNQRNQQDLEELEKQIKFWLEQLAKQPYWKENEPKFKNNRFDIDKADIDDYANRLLSDLEDQCILLEYQQIRISQYSEIHIQLIHKKIAAQFMNVEDVSDKDKTPIQSSKIYAKAKESKLKVNGQVNITNEPKINVQTPTKVTTSTTLTQLDIQKSSQKPAQINEVQPFSCYCNKSDRSNKELDCLYDSKENDDDSHLFCELSKHSRSRARFIIDELRKMREEQERDLRESRRIKKSQRKRQQKVFSQSDSSDNHQRNSELAELNKSGYLELKQYESQPAPEQQLEQEVVSPLEKNKKKANKSQRNKKNKGKKHAAESEVECKVETSTTNISHSELTPPTSQPITKEPKVQSQELAQDFQEDHKTSLVANNDDDDEYYTVVPKQKRTKHTKSNMRRTNHSEQSDKSNSPKDLVKKRQVQQQQQKKETKGEPKLKKHVSEPAKPKEEQKIQQQPQPVVKETIQPPPPALIKQSSASSVNSSGKERHALKPTYARLQRPQQQQQQQNHEPQQSVDQFIENRVKQDLEEYLKGVRYQTQQYFAAREIVSKRLHTLAGSFFSQYRAYPQTFGSQQSGLALPESDIDIAIVGLNFCTKDVLVGLMSYFQQLLGYFSWISNLKCIPHAQVPIIKLEVDPSIPFENNSCHYTIQDQNLRNSLNICSQKVETRIFHVDITFEQGDPYSMLQHQGLKSTEMISEWIKQNNYFSEITILLKILLKRRQLNDYYRGGISSFCLALMLKAVYQYYRNEPFTSVLHVLEKFLYKYGLDFDPNKYGILISSENGFYSLDEGPINNYPISIKSPITNGIVTMGTSCIPEIQLEFKKLYQSICSYKNDLKVMLENTDPDIVNQILSGRRVDRNAARSELIGEGSFFFKKYLQ